MKNFDRFITYLEEREGWAFGYSNAPQTHDCARFCGGAVEAACGSNPLAKFDGAWTSERGAKRVLARYGGMGAAISTVMNEIPVTIAQRADVGMTTDGELVLFDGDGIIGLDRHRGYVRGPRSQAVRAWTV